MLRKVLALMAALSLIGLMGCGGGDATPAPSGGGGGGATAPKPPAPAGGGETKKSGGEAYNKDKGTASVKGTVSIDGNAPGRPKIAIADPKCAAMHSEPLLSEAVVAKDGKLANAIVYVKSGQDKYTYDNAVPTDAVTIDQKGCQYVPHVIALMTGQEFDIKSSDDLAHNIHGMSATQPFNESQAKPSMIKKKFNEPEMGMRIQCDIHKWMGAYACVFDHPFFAVTKDDGSYEIKGLPPGDYEIAVWHESAQGKDDDKLEAAASAKITVGDKEAKTQDFKLKAKAE